VILLLQVSSIMIRQVWRGLLPGHLIVKPPPRPPEKILSGSSIPRPDSHRAFCISCQLRKQTDSRFFWPSRPDFLPTKSVKADETKQFNGRERRKRAAQSIKRFRPVSGAKIALPSPEGITYAHAPMYTSIAKVEVDSAWTHFVSHLKDLSDNKAAPLESNLFDALFWLIAAENITSGQRHGEVFGRVEILYMYANSQADYGPTSLQLHRTVYIWTSLWEQYEIQNMAFPHAKFKETVLNRLNELDSRLASRVFSRLLNGCKTPDEIESVSVRIKSWLQIGQCKMTRQETWASTSALDSPNDEVYFNEEHRGRLDGQMWEDVLEKCFQIGISKETVSAGMLALRQAELDPSLDYVSQLLAFLDTNRLYNLLPTDVRNGAAAIKHTYPLPPSTEQDADYAAEEDRLFTENDRKRLVYAIAFVLATRTHYSAALYLYEADKKILKEGELSNKKIEVYTAAANACARLAANVPSADHSLHDAKWTLIQLQRGLRLFIDCEWYDSRSRDATADLLIKALWSCMVIHQSKADVQSSTQWLLLLRQFTTILLTHDPDLSALHIEGDISSYSYLLRLHIHLKDYPFTKRLFLIKSMQEGHGDSVELLLKRSDFLWLFEQSLENEDDFRFSSQLFLYWTSLDEKHITALPPSLLRMYFRKLKAAKSGRVAVQMLHEHVDVNQPSGTKQKLPPNQAIRTMRTYFGGDTDTLDLSLNMAEVLLEYWKQKKEGQWTTFVHLYSIAMQGSTKRTNLLDAILRSRVMGLFTSFRKHFDSLPIPKRHSIGAKSRDDLQIIYACALKILIEEKEKSHVYKKAEELIEELRDYWKIQKYSGELWSLRVEARLAGSDADVDQAKSLYSDAMQALDGREKVEILSASVTAKLMMALGKKGNYKEALDLISTYQNHAGPLPSSKSAVLIEGAHIAILHMQGHVDEALQRLEALKMQGAQQSFKIGRERKKTNEKWLKIVSQATEGLEEQIKSQEEVQRRESSEYDLPFAFSEEEEERERMFRAMAGGQPWKRH
jgi:hypothetical protein